MHFSDSITTIRGVSKVDFQLPSGSIFGVFYDPKNYEVVFNYSKSIQQLPITSIDFSMSVSDDATSCLMFDSAATNQPCSAAFSVGLDIVEASCPDDINFDSPDVSSTLASVVWSDALINSPLPFIGSLQPGSLFHIGTTPIVYQLDTSDQSSLQPTSSRLQCEFDVSFEKSRSTFCKLFSDKWPHVFFC